MPLAAWRRNVRLFVTYRAGMAALVYTPISLPFYQSLGFSLAQFTQLYALQAFVILLTDIPTGFIADRFGYRRMLLSGVAIQACGFGALAMTYSKDVAWALQVVIAFGQSIARGADGPLARKSAEAINVDFRKVSSRGVAAMGVGEGLASLVAALLAWQAPEQAPRVVIALQAVVYVALLYVPWKMVEPPGAVQESTRRTWTTAVSGVKSGLRSLALSVRHELAHNIEARWLVFYGAVIGCTTQTAVPLMQPLFKVLSLELWQYALLWAGYSFLWAAFSLSSGWYESLLGRWGALASLVVWGIATNVAMAVLGSAGLVAIIAFYFIRGVQMAIILDYMTGVVTPDRRATLLAVLTTAQLAMSVPSTIGLGYLAEGVSVHAAFAASAGLYGVLGLVSIRLLRAATPR